MFLVFCRSIVDEKCEFQVCSRLIQLDIYSIYSPKVLEERLGYVCVLYVCLYVCAIDDIRGHKLVASWCVLPHTVCLKLKTAFGNRQLHMQVQASSFFWNLDESAARATSPRGRNLLRSVAAVSLPWRVLGRLPQFPPWGFRVPACVYTCPPLPKRLTSWPLQAFGLEIVLYSPVLCDLLCHRQGQDSVNFIWWQYQEAARGGN